jgi:hypothetical protein
MPGYISSLSYTFDNTNTNWETAKLPEDMNLLDPDIRASSYPGALQLPKHIDVSVSFVPVGVYRPEFRGIMYSLYDDSAENGNVETGLMPTNGNRVNYFIEHFDADGKPVIYTGTVNKNGKRVSYAGEPIQGITPIEQPENKIASTTSTTTDTSLPPAGSGVLQSSQNVPGTGTNTLNNVVPNFTAGTNSTGGTNNVVVPLSGNPSGTTGGNTPPPPGSPPDQKTKTSTAVVTSTSTISPAPTAIEEKIFQLAVVGNNPVTLYEYVGTRGILFQNGAKDANKNGYAPFGPGKDAAIKYIRAFIGVKQDGTTNASD